MNANPAPPPLIMSYVEQLNQNILTPQSTMFQQVISSLRTFVVTHLRFATTTSESYIVHEKIVNGMLQWDPETASDIIQTLVDQNRFKRTPSVSALLTSVLKTKTLQNDKQWRESGAINADEKKSDASLNTIDVHIASLAGSYRLIEILCNSPTLRDDGMKMVNQFLDVTQTPEIGVTMCVELTLLWLTKMDAMHENEHCTPRDIYTIAAQLRNAVEVTLNTRVNPKYTSVFGRLYRLLPNPEKKVSLWSNQQLCPVNMLVAHTLLVQTLTKAISMWGGGKLPSRYVHECILAGSVAFQLISACSESGLHVLSREEMGLEPTKLRAWNEIVHNTIPETSKMPKELTQFHTSTIIDTYLRIAECEQLSENERADAIDFLMLRQSRIPERVIVKCTAIFEQLQQPKKTLGSVFNSQNAHESSVLRGLQEFLRVIGLYAQGKSILEPSPPPLQEQQAPITQHHTTSSNPDSADEEAGEQFSLSKLPTITFTPINIPAANPNGATLQPQNTQQQQQHSTSQVQRRIEYRRMLEYQRDRVFQEIVKYAREENVATDVQLNITNSLNRISTDTTSIGGYSLVQCLIYGWQLIEVCDEFWFLRGVDKATHAKLFKSMMIAEIADMSDTCTTGHFTRLANSLGFVSFTDIELLYARFTAFLSHTLQTHPKSDAFYDAIGVFERNKQVLISEIVSETSVEFQKQNPAEFANVGVTKMWAAHLVKAMNIAHPEAVALLEQKICV